MEHVLPSFTIKLDPDAQQELHGLRAFDRTAIQASIERHLSSDPTRLSRSRIKKLAPPALADFRLAVGEWRVLYNVDEAEKLVYVVAVRHKGRRTFEEVADGEVS